MSLFNELKRRNVIRVGIAYIVAAWLTIQVVETLFPVFDIGNESIRLVVILLAIGLLPVLFFAWAFELTTDGVKREKDVDRSHSIAPQTGKKLDRWVIIMLAIALTYFTFDKFVLDPGRDAELVSTAVEQTEQAALNRTPDNSIAVLPFLNISSDKEQEYFSDGMTEELINMLTKIPELSVVSRSTAFSYKGTNLQVPDVAKQLGVNYILEGSVRKAGKQLRITTQLVDTRFDTQLWSETYDRSLENIFAIQDEIAGHVVRQMKVALLGEVPKSDKTDPEAYSLFLQARYLRSQFSFNNLDRMISLLEQATEIAPDFKRAWSLLGSTYTRQARAGHISQELAYEKAVAANQRALDIDPDDISALALMGWMEILWNNDLHAAAVYYQRVADQIEDIELRAGYCYDMLRALGRYDVNLWDIERRYKENPASPHTTNGLTMIYTRAGRYSEAAAMAQVSVDLSPGVERGRQRLNYALLRDGRPDEALKAISEEPNEAYRLESLVMTYHDLGQVSDFKESLEKFLALNDVPAERYALVYSHVGQKDLAFEWLEKVREIKPLPYLLIHYPHLDNLKTDSRWLPYLESIGQSPAQLASVDFSFPEVP